MTPEGERDDRPGHGTTYRTVTREPEGSRCKRSERPPAGLRPRPATPRFAPVRRALSFYVLKVGGGLTAWRPKTA